MRRLPSLAARRPLFVFTLLLASAAPAHILLLTERGAGLGGFALGPLPALAVAVAPSWRRVRTS